MIYLDDLDFSEMEDFVEKHGLQKYRAGQIFSFIHKNKAESLDEITVLKKDLREKLKNECALTEVKIIHRAISKLCLLYTSPSPRDVEESRMPSSA